MNAAQTSEDYAIRLGGTHFPIYYPKLLTSRVRTSRPQVGEYPRKYRIMDPDHKWHDAYRLVVVQSALSGAYYGIQGTSWTDPPILRNPSADTRTIHGKKLLLFYDGKLLRSSAGRRRTRRTGSRTRCGRRSRTTRCSRSPRRSRASGASRSGGSR